MNDVLIFLTATIDCGATPFVGQANPAERERDYLVAFRQWLSLNYPADILFCENSNADLSAFKAALNRADLNEKRAFLLGFEGNEGAQSRGKGYGEVEMLRHAFRSFPDIEKYRWIVKVTGRYWVRNASELIRQITTMRCDLVCDIHRNLTLADCRALAFTPAVAANYIIPFQGEIDDTRGVFAEHLVARCTHRLILAGGTWAPLPITPYARGMSGTLNTYQRDTWVWRVKQSIKRKLALWIYWY